MRNDVKNKAREIAGKLKHTAERAVARYERARFLSKLIGAALDAGLNVDGMDEQAAVVRLFRGDCWAARGEGIVTVRFPGNEDCAGFTYEPTHARAVSVQAWDTFPSRARKGSGVRCRVQVREGVGDVDRIISLALANL